MFDSLTERFQQDLTAFKIILDAHDRARDLFEEPLVEPDRWAAVRATNLSKTTWHVYDHCAAFTRLYAIYATYVDDLVEEFLKLLPRLYATYDLLPPSVTVQHRNGLSAILGKLGPVGPYRHLNEIDIVTALHNGLTGVTPYKLITEAFYPDRQNYRLDVLARMLSYLGIDTPIAQLSEMVQLGGSSTERVQKHPP